MVEHLGVARRGVSGTPWYCVLVHGMFIVRGGFVGCGSRIAFRMFNITAASCISRMRRLATVPAGFISVTTDTADNLMLARPKTVSSRACHLIVAAVAVTVRSTAHEPRVGSTYCVKAPIPEEANCHEVRYD
jgi:hypothetical protein